MIIKRVFIQPQPRNNLASVQSLQKSFGQEPEAAMAFEPFSLSTSTLVQIGIGWIATALSEEAVELFNTTVVQPIGDATMKDLSHSHEETRNIAIGKIKDAVITSIETGTIPINGTKISITNPQEMISTVEKIFSLSLIKSIELNGEALNNSKDAISAQAALLEGLYAIDDRLSTSKIVLDSTVTHGWQDNSPIWNGTRRAANIVSTATNPLHWNKTDLKKTFGDADFTLERGWYECSSTPDMCASVLEHAHEGKFPALNQQAQDSLRRILILNKKVPVTSSGNETGKINGSSIPSYKRSKAYRIGMYETMLSVLSRDDDPLYLKSHIDSVPMNERARSEKFRKDLLDALVSEVAFKETDSSRYSESSCNLILKILDKATGVERYLWNEEAKNQKAIEEKNKRDCMKFCGWGGFIRAGSTPYPIREMELAFEQLSQYQKDKIGLLNDFHNTNSFPDETALNERLHKEILVYMELESNTDGEKLTQDNSHKGLYFLRYLNQELNRSVKVGQNPERPLLAYLSPQLKEYLITATRPFIHNVKSFPATARNLDFFLNPHESSVPGQALLLNHSLTRCFTNGGYADLFGYRDRILKTVVANLHETRDSYDSGYLFSGPMGTGKSSLAAIVANQMGLPLFTLSPDKIIRNGLNFYIEHEGQNIPVARYFDIVQSSSPCVLLLDEVEAYLKPRRVDECSQGSIPPEQEALTTLFLTPIQNLRSGVNQSSPIALFMTTNAPRSSDLDLDSIDRNGDSAKAKLELYKYISAAAIREKRIDFVDFSFHRKYSNQQGSALVQHFLTPLIQSGKLDKATNMAKAGEFLALYTPAAIEKAVSTATDNQGKTITFDSIKKELSTSIPRFIEQKNPKLRRIVLSIITTLVDVDETKSISTPLDFDAITERAEELTPAEISRRIREYAPKELTTENVIAALKRTG